MPASSANLGPGYDCLGVALPLRNVLEVERRAGPLEVSVSGEGADTLPADAGNLVVRSFAQVWDEPLDGLAVPDAERRAAAGGNGLVERGDRGRTRRGARASEPAARQRRADRAGRAAGGSSRQRGGCDRGWVHARTRRRATPAPSDRATARARLRAGGARPRAVHDGVAQAPAPRGAAGRRRLQPAAHRAARARALDR